MLNYEEFLELKKLLKAKEQLSEMGVCGLQKEIALLEKIVYDYEIFELNMAQKVFLASHLDMFNYIDSDFMNEKWVLFKDNIDSDFPYTLWVGDDSYESICEDLFDRVTFY